MLAEDSAPDRLLLSRLLERLGHRVLLATNGAEAIEQFIQMQPEMVLLDALMPVLDGFEAAKQIKQLAGDRLVPIIFLTALSETQALLRSIEAGGDDFLSKPYNALLLEAKIKAMNRLRLMHAKLREQRDWIAQYNQRLLAEQQAAKEVFDNITHSGCLRSANIRYRQSAYALFNGDLLLAAYRPSGPMHVLLGDFTGHGLPAAIGAMPVADAFYSMTARGYGPSEILSELNGKLKRILPPQMFCCACLLSIDVERGVLEYWNGGLPNGYLHKADGSGHVPIVSAHLPLGVLSNTEFVAACEVLPLAQGDRILLLSDGLLEARNAAGEAFGEQRLLACLAAAAPQQSLFEALESALALFRGQAHDDESLLELVVTQNKSAHTTPDEHGKSWLINAQDWSASFEFRAQTLRSFNPLPFLLQLLLEVRGLRGRTGDLYVVLHELYANALEHGIMCLDSGLKQSAQGFSEYYQLRRERLRSLNEGLIRFSLQIIPRAGGGCLQLRIEDSGEGFDVTSVNQPEVVSTGLSGRGLRLIRQLADDCHWEQGGRVACVEFRWQNVTD